MTDEWGPWIDHDGAGCPVLGEYVEAETEDGTIIDYVAGDMGRRCRSWNRRFWPEYVQIIRYRVCNIPSRAAFRKIAPTPQPEGVE